MIKHDKSIQKLWIVPSCAIQFWYSPWTSLSYTGPPPSTRHGIPLPADRANLGSPWESLKKKTGSRLLSCFSPSSETLSTCKSLDFTKKMQLSAIEMEFEPHSATKSFDITW